MVAAHIPQTLVKSGLAMSLTASRGELKKAIATLGRVADKKSCMPMLGGVAIKVTPEATTLTTTDLNVWATYTTQPSGRMAGATVVKVKSLADILGKMPEGEITIAGDNPHVYVMAGTASVHVDSYVARDYPKVPDTSALVWFSVDGADLGACIKRVMSAVCQDETRFHLNGVYLHCEGKTLRAVATDGHRLAYARSSYDDAYQLFSKGMILPSKGLKEVVRLIGKGGTCEIARNEHMFFVRKGEWQLAIKHIDAQFPPYEQVIPSNSPHAVAVDIASLRGACERAKAVAGKASTVGMSIARGDNDPTLRLSCGLDERIEESLPCSLGDAFKVGVNPTYLLDALEHMESRTLRVEILIGKELDPILVFSHDEDARSAPIGMRHFAVVMPMRI